MTTIYSDDMEEPEKYISHHYYTYVNTQKKKKKVMTKSNTSQHPNKVTPSNFTMMSRG